MKRFFTFSLLAILLLTLLAPVAYAEESETTPATEAEEEIRSGWLENDFKWELEDGELRIYGYGAIPGEAPWLRYSGEIESVVFENTVVTVAPGSFRDCENLETIDFGTSMVEIGDYAFQGCTALKEIRLPSTFRRFGASSFGGCRDLSQVYIDGYMPRFSENCLWNDGRIYIYYSPEYVWGIEDVKTLERNFSGRLEVLCQDGTDPIPNDEDEPIPPAPVAQETKPAPTEAPTAPTTEATEPPTIPTVPITVPTVPAVVETTVPVPHEEPTNPWVMEETEPIIEEETVRGGFLGLALILGVLTFFIVGALVFKSRSRKGKY